MIITCENTRLSRKLQKTYSDLDPALFLRDILLCNRTTSPDGKQKKLCKAALGSANLVTRLNIKDGYATITAIDGMVVRSCADCHLY